jgi:hypothetical protein
MPANHKNKQKLHALAFTPFVVVASVMSSAPIPFWEEVSTYVLCMNNIEVCGTKVAVAPTVELDLRLHNMQKDEER